MNEAAVPRRRAWLPRLLLIFGVLAVIGLVISTSLFLSMTDWQTLTPQQAEARLIEARALAGGTEAYLQVNPDRSIVLRRELEPPHPAPIGHLQLLAWIPARTKMMTVRVPAWFLRLKSGGSFGLAMLASEFADLLNGSQPLDMKDLQRRGPGLLLDLPLDDGGRLLLWSTPKD